jgi:hypothetical protein
MVKKAGNTRAMEEALQAAVSRMNGSSSLPPPAPASGPIPMDPMSLLLSVLPKLLARDSDEEGLSEKFDELKNEELPSLREALAQQTERIAHIHKAQRVLLREVRQLSSVINTLALQLERIELLDDTSDGAGGPLVEDEHPRSSRLGRRGPGSGSRL